MGCRLLTGDVGIQDWLNRGNYMGSLTRKIS